MESKKKQLYDSGFNTRGVVFRFTRSPTNSISTYGTSAMQTGVHLNPDINQPIDLTVRLKRRT